MKTEREIVEMFKNANPKPRPSIVVEADPPKAASSRTGSEGIIELDRRSPRITRTRRQLVWSVAAIAGLAIVFIAARITAPDTLLIPESTTATAGPLGSPSVGSVDVATQAMNAIAHYDRDALLRLLAPGTESLSVGSTDTMLSRLDWYRAIDWRFENVSCDSATGTSAVECSFLMSNRVSRYRGMDPYPGATAFAVSDGFVTDITERLESFEHWSRSFLPFMGWVQETHPEQFGVMFSAPDDGFPILTPESIQLFEDLSIEYTAGDRLRSRLCGRSSPLGQTEGQPPSRPPSPQHPK